ncbi:hydantoinase B/oxoprolinase family protein [Amycolatopsis jejuensis]|uniref:hydantoinase B/oxoprolinase family protein n=1 Tax=Amycolatopsis jejuensis TaxID=330084 RepID=UPI000525CFB5|nr:hydantoinase B/oxoprolinase family protein [Amycolatopsis jejuensis]
MAAAVSPVDLEILRVRLTAMAQELAVTLAHAAPNREVSQCRESAVAIVDPGGGVAAIDNLLALGSLTQTARRILDDFEFDLKDGDVVVTNDPYGGGTRVPDLTLLTPYVVDGSHVAHLVVQVRLPDTAGRVSGNFHPGATEIWAEGVVVPPVKIRRLGRATRDVLGTLLLNGRHPQETRRLLDVATAVLNRGLSLLDGLVHTHGVELVENALEHTQYYSEKLARAAIRSWPDGRYPAEHNGIRLVAAVEGDSLTLDFSGSDEQQPSFVNCSAGTTASSAAVAVLALLGEEVPANGGVLRAVTIRTRPGTITHAVRPAPVGWGPDGYGSTVTGTTLAALGQAAPGFPVSLTASRPLVLTRPAGDRSRHTDLGQWAPPAAGATANADGWGRPPFAARSELPSVEQWESDHETRIRRLEFEPGTAGAGQWTGAPAVEVEIDLPPNRLCTLWTGHSAGVWFRDSGTWQPSVPVATEQEVAGDRVRVRLAGGAGSGDPAERDRGRVALAVADGLISRETAHEVYRLGAAELDDLLAGYGMEGAGA